jgi:hypothetical protein
MLKPDLTFIWPHHSTRQLVTGFMAERGRLQKVTLTCLKRTTFGSELLTGQTKRQALALLCAVWLFMPHHSSQANQKAPQRIWFRCQEASEVVQGPKSGQSYNRESVLVLDRTKQVLEEYDTNRQELTTIKPAFAENDSKREFRITAQQVYEKESDLATSIEITIDRTNLTIHEVLEMGVQLYMGNPTTIIIGDGQCDLTSPQPLAKRRF